ncbi:MAG: ABC transporter permease subunit [Alistipes sp.]|nr:ABC transporter permease subunit [Alistipes sp.]
MKIPQIKKIGLVAHLWIAIAIFGLALPAEAYAVPESGREQAAQLVVESSENAGVEVAGQSDTLPAIGVVSSEIHAAEDKAEGDHRVVKSHESLDKRWRNAVQSVLSWDMWRLILGGLRTTVIIFIFAAIAAILLGALLTYLAISHKWPWLYKPLSWFVTTVHDIPSVALMMFFYYVIFAGEMNGVVVSIIALGVYTSGSLAKIFKIHILQVGPGQIEAGRALGMTTRQCYRYIVLPQAVKSMLPLVIADLKVQLRATSYAGYIAQKDLIKAVFAVREQYADTFLPLIIVSIMYLILSWMIAQVIQSLYVKFFKYD